MLAVEDDVDMQDTIRNIVEKDGFSVRFSKNGKMMREEISARRPNLVLLDLILPDENGLDLARELKSEHKIPFIILSGKGDVIDRVVGLEIGADDYIAKPFHARELVARIHTVLRRVSESAQTYAPTVSNEHFYLGDWCFDLLSQSLQREGQPSVGLTTHECRVLETLVRNSGKILSRDRIIDVVSGRDWMPFDRSVDVVIGKLRQKLQDDPKQPTFIRTLRNAGYSFIGPVKKGS